MNKQFAFPAGNAAILPGITDRQNWTFHDWQTYAAAGQTSLTFFGAGSSGRSLEDTNFPGSGGSLPAGFTFVLQEIQFMFQPGTTVPVAKFGADVEPLFVRDVYAVGRNGLVQLDYGPKTFVQEGPLCRFPCDTRMVGVVAAAAAGEVADAQTLIQYAQWGGRPFRVADLRIDPLQPLKVQALWPNGVVALPSTVAGRLGCFMRGTLTRNAS